MQLMERVHTDPRTRWAFTGALILGGLSLPVALLLAIMAGGMLGGSWMEQLGSGALGVLLGVVLGFVIVLAVVVGVASIIGATAGMLLHMLLAGVRRHCRV